MIQSQLSPPAEEEEDQKVDSLHQAEGFVEPQVFAAHLSLVAPLENSFLVRAWNGNFK